jgi:hypothetical protein
MVKKFEVSEGSEGEDSDDESDDDEEETEEKPILRGKNGYDYCDENVFIDDDEVYIDEN